METTFPGSFPDRSPRIRRQLAELLAVQPEELIDDLNGRWFVVIDALTGVEVPTSLLDADLHVLGQVLTGLRAVLPAQEVPW